MSSTGLVQRRRTQLSTTDSEGTLTTTTTSLDTNPTFLHTTPSLHSSSPTTPPSSLTQKGTFPLSSTSTPTPTPTTSSCSSSHPHHPTPSSFIYRRSSSGSTHIVAYDPNEVPLDTHPDDPSQPIPFTLMEEVFLLGLKSKEGHLSFWNDSLSYVLRGCILMELFLRNRIQLLPPSPTTLASSPMLLSARPIKVINSKITSEVLLDETLRLMKQTEVGLGTGVSSLSSEGKLDPFQKKNGSSSQYWSVHTWMDVLSGETWNLLRASYQLRQVRERIAKGLVDKGVLRNEKKSFFMFDVAIHPLVNTQVKTDLIQRLLHVLHLPWPSSGWHHVHLRTILLLLAAYAGNVLDPIFHDLSLHQKELGYQRLEALLKAFSQIEPKHKQCGGDVDGLETTQSSIHGNETRKVYSNMFGVEYPEGVAAVLSVFSKMDNLI